MGIGQARWGEGEAPLKVSGLQLPDHLEIVGDELHWGWVEPGPGLRVLSFDREDASPDGLLDAFLRIKDSEDVLRFAKRYGPLGLCEHGLPASHNNPALPKRDFSLNALAGCLPRSVGPRRAVPRLPGLVAWMGTFREPVEEWLSFARDAERLLLLVLALREGDQPAVGDLAPVLDMFLNSPIAPMKQMIAGVLNWWLFIGGAGPALTWEEKPALVLRSTPLPQVPQAFGVLATQLMMAAASEKGFRVCPCGQWFPLTGRADQKYCTPGCASKYRMRIYDSPEARAKRAALRRTSATGTA